MSLHLPFCAKKWEPIARPGELIKLPCNYGYTNFKVFEIVDYYPIDNLDVVICPRDDPSITILQPNNITKIRDPRELRLEEYELLQLRLKYMNFPLMYVIGTGETTDMVFSRYSRTTLWIDWNTPKYNTVVYVTGAMILDGRRPTYYIYINNPWSFQIPDDGNSPVKIPYPIVMTFEGYRFIIAETEPKEGIKPTLVPVLPFIPEFKVTK